MELLEMSIPRYREPDDIAKYRYLFWLAYPAHPRCSRILDRRPAGDGGLAYPTQAPRCWSLKTVGHR